MKKLIISILVSTLFTLQSCENKAKKNRETKDHWDFTSKAFKDKNIRLLSRYDVFHFTQQSDSIIFFEGEIFQGWKNKSSEIKDTLQLTEKFFVEDSIGNRTKQLLSYSKQNQTYFQLIITKKELSSVDEKGQAKTDISFDYEGKLFINKKSFQYFSDFLYTK
ncbi:MAG: hypothetical protein KA796_04455 [Chryseobacterium sp.]|nr:hypothetical protein [Chryseobacterium sp.]MBP7499102.1 hypothetical protein [Chryseobacterium sp.]